MVAYSLLLWEVGFGSHLSVIPLNHLDGSIYVCNPFFHNSVCVLKFLMRAHEKKKKQFRRSIREIMMKVYLASSFDLIKKVEALAKVLREKGHTVTVEWWHKDYKKLPLADVDWYEDARVIAISERNFRGIREADIFVLIAPTLTSKKFNGANIELGYALALGKPCYSVGLLQRSAMYVPVIQCDSIEEVLERCGQ